MKISSERMKKTNKLFLFFLHLCSCSCLFCIKTTCLNKNNKQKLLKLLLSHCCNPKKLYLYFLFCYNILRGSLILCICAVLIKKALFFCFKIREIFLVCFQSVMLMKDDISHYVRKKIFVNKKKFHANFFFAIKIETKKSELSTNIRSYFVL